MAEVFMAFLQNFLQKQRWHDLISTRDKIVNWKTSPDGLFFYSTAGNNPRIFRMRTSDHVVEEVTNLQNMRVVDDPYTSTQVSVAPDDTPVVTPRRRHRGTLRHLGQVSVIPKLMGRATHVTLCRHLSGVLAHAITADACR
jgi:hypothetical protein